MLKMIKKLTCLFIFITSCFTIFSCTNEPAIILSPLPENALVLALGDSLTFGSGVKTQAQSYPSVLASLIQRKVINAGYPGIDSANLLKKTPALLNEYQPNLVILCVGGNDMLRHVNDKTIQYNIEKIVEMIRMKGIDILLIAVPKPGLFFLNPAKFYKEIAHQFNIPLEEDTLTDLESDAQYKSDSIHLNAKGYAKLAQAIASELMRLGAIRQRA